MICLIHCALRIYFSFLLFISANKWTCLILGLDYTIFIILSQQSPCEIRQSLWYKCMPCLRQEFHVLVHWQIERSRNCQSWLEKERQGTHHATVLLINYVKLQGPYIVLDLLIRILEICHPWKKSSKLGEI